MSEILNNKRTLLCGDCGKEVKVNRYICESGIDLNYTCAGCRKVVEKKS